MPRSEQHWWRRLPDDMTFEELERLEAASDPLLDLVALAETRRPDSPAWEDPRFLAWLAREHGGDPELSRVLDEEAVRGLARRVVRECARTEFGVRRAEAAAPVLPSDFPGPASTLVDELALERRAPLLDLAVAAGAGRALWDAECESCVPLPAELPPGRYLALRVSGASMEPLMHSGDIVLVRLGAEVAPDTIIVARTPEDGYVVKRVGRVTRRSLRLLSLNPAFEPIDVPRVQNAVLGTVVLRWCDHGEE